MSYFTREPAKPLTISLTIIPYLGALAASSEHAEVNFMFISQQQTTLLPLVSYHGPNYAEASAETSKPSFLNEQYVSGLISTPFALSLPGPSYAHAH